MENGISTEMSKAAGSFWIVLNGLSHISVYSMVHNKELKVFIPLRRATDDEFGIQNGAGRVRSNTYTISTL